MDCCVSGLIPEGGLFTGGAEPWGGLAVKKAAEAAFFALNAVCRERELIRLS
jgi:hypothetical protein